jgi:hypothetical protein
MRIYKTKCIKNYFGLLSLIFVFFECSTAISKPLIGKYMYGSINFHEIKDQQLLGSNILGSLHRVRLRVGDIDEQVLTRHGRKKTYYKKIKWMKESYVGYVFCSQKTPFIAYQEDNNIEFIFVDFVNGIQSEDIRGDWNIYMKVCHNIDDDTDKQVKAIKDNNYAPDKEEFIKKTSKVKNIKEILNILK